MWKRYNNFRNAACPSDVYIKLRFCQIHPFLPSKFQNICCLLNLDFDRISIKSCFISCLIMGLDVSHKLTHIIEEFLPSLW